MSAGDDAVMSQVMSTPVCLYVPTCLTVLTCLAARRQVVSRSYVGCIKNVEIARSNFDLLRDAFGVRKGCVLEVVHISHIHI